MNAVHCVAMNLEIAHSYDIFFHIFFCWELKSFYVQSLFYDLFFYNIDLRVHIIS